MGIQYFKRTSTVLGKTRATTSPGLIPAVTNRAVADSVRLWRREWVRSNFPATEMARREGNLAATWRSKVVSVIGVSMVSFIFFFFPLNDDYWIVLLCVWGVSIYRGRDTVGLGDMWGGMEDMKEKAKLGTWTAGKWACIDTCRVVKSGHNWEVSFSYKLFS